MNLKDYALKLLNNNCKNSRRTISMLKNQNLWDQIPKKHLNDAQNLYDFLFVNHKKCPHNRVTFVSFSVGYRYCSNNCACVILSKSNKVSKSKTNYSAEQKNKIQQKRKQTNLTKYGVENLFHNRDLVKKSMLDRHGVENPRHIPGVDQKIINTNQQKYGVDNPSKNPNIKLKQSQTWKSNAEQHVKKYKQCMLDRHGVENPRHIPGVDQKIINTNQQKYGVDNPSKNTAVRQKISKNSLSSFYYSLPTRIDQTIIPLFDQDSYQGTVYHYLWKCTNCNSQFVDRLINGTEPICRKCHPYAVSAFEQEIRDFVNCGEFNNRYIIAPYEIDIFVPEHGLAIECNGVYRHSEINGKDKKYHINKTKLCQSKNIRLIQILDIEWYEKQQIVQSIINSALGRNQKIHARKCQICKIDSDVCARFLDQNHIQGHVNSKINYGLYYQNQLVSAMTFAESRYNKKYQWEMLRFSNKTNINVAGGAARLFKTFVKNIKPQSVISYCDQRVFTGTVYQKLGFKSVAETKPGYYYFNTKKKIKLESREKYQKHKLKDRLSLYDQNLTEWENMKINGYDRIWNCGNTVWAWEIT
jgi:hypothetical protein